MWLLIMVQTVLVSGTGTESVAHQNETENLSNMVGSISNPKLVLFVMTDAKACSESLAYGSATLVANKNQKPYFSTAAKGVRHDTWTQYLYPDGIGSKEVMTITWKFDNVQTIEDRFYNAVMRGEKVKWIIKWKGKTTTKSQFWRFSNGMTKVKSKFGSNSKNLFSHDDGAWGGGSKISVNGNGPAPSDYYGQANWNGGDSMCNRLYVNGKFTSHPNLQVLVYTGDKELTMTTTTTTTTLMSMVLKTFMLPEFSSWVIKDAGGKKIVCQGKGQANWYSTIKVDCKLAHKKSYMVTCMNNKVGGWAGGYLQVKGGQQLCSGYKWSQGSSWTETFTAR